MGIEEGPKSERELKKGEEIIIPDSYVSRGRLGYADQKATHWVIMAVITGSDIPPHKHNIPYAIVVEKNGSASKHIPLEELRSANA